MFFDKRKLKILLSLIISLIRRKPKLQRCPLMLVLSNKYHKQFSHPDSEIYALHINFLCMHTFQRIYRGEDLWFSIFFKILRMDIASIGCHSNFAFEVIRFDFVCATARAGHKYAINQLHAILTLVILQT